jgi:bifunctional non-homologous end joining protein LigD
MRPMLATPGPQPAGPEWLHEVKWDGMRVLVDVTERGVRLYARSGRDVTASYPELSAISEAVQDALIDGEIIALADGLPSFAALAERIHVTDERRAAELSGTYPITVMTFDLLRLYGVELLGRPVEDRRASLDKLELPPGRWQHSPSYSDGPALLAATREQGLEGVVAKRRGSTYQPGRRSKDWIKTANRHQQACLVGGWRPEAGTTDRIGALLIGVNDDDGRFAFAGRVGSGISHHLSQDLSRLLAPLTQPRSPFDDEVPRLDGAGATWCDPQIVIEVRHLGWTGRHRLRQPVFRALRTDLDPAEVRREP